MNETITIGVFVSFAFYLGMFWEPISRLGQVYNQLLMGMASSERIFEFLDEQPNVKEKPNAIHNEKINGEISFEEVEFSYDENEKPFTPFLSLFRRARRLRLSGIQGAGRRRLPI